MEESTDITFRSYGHQPTRPWHSLYGKNLPLPAAQQTLLAPIQKMIPEELLLEIFRVANHPIAISRAACVCRQWRDVTSHESLWRTACLRAFKMTGKEYNTRQVEITFGGSWKIMFLNRPRVRHDGFYVSRNTYIKPGERSMNCKYKPVHLVCYFRYYRFFPEGRLLYRTTPLALKKAAREMLGRQSANEKNRVYAGSWSLQGTKVSTAWRYPGCFNTEVCTELTLRSTSTGACNRLDVEAMMSSRTEVNRGGGEFGDPETSSTAHRQKVASYVFVAFEEVETHDLNLPVEVMDFYCPG